jgi:hypothetical protein
MATERILSRFPSGEKLHAEYLVDDAVVGIRHFHESGEPSFEVPLRRGRLSGVQYRWDSPGVLLSSEPYLDGRAHGIARQWHDGELVGSYEMVHGTGLDLWWGQEPSGGRYLAEARTFRDGRYEGFEWWLEVDQRSVYEERHFHDGALHGIERRWGSKGSLQKGYPKYWVNGTQVMKRLYLRACKVDATLPPFRESDHLPERRFPAEIDRALGRPKGD